MVSPIGYILIPLGLVLFLRGRRMLLWATVASIPITMVTIVDIGVTSITGFQFFGSLFIARCIVDGLWKKNLRFQCSGSKVAGIIFIAVCFFSIAMAAVKSGSVKVLGEGGKWSDVYANVETLRLSTRNFTQVIFPFWGFLLYLFLTKEMKSIADLKVALNILIWGALIIGLSSVLSGILFNLRQGSLYAELLNSLKVATPEIGKPRVGTFGLHFRSFTLAGEPGDSSLYYLVGLGFLVGFASRDISNTRKTILSLKSKFLFFLIVVVINGSTAAYLGVFLLLVWVLPALLLTSGRSSVSIRTVVMGLAGGMILLYIVGTTIEVGDVSLVEWVQQYHIAKLQGEAGSGSIRRTVMLHGLNVFLENPILGVGYGSNLSLSFGVFLISNVGLLGTGMFFLFLLLELRKVIFVAKKSEREIGAIAFSLVLILPPFVGVLLTGIGTFALNLGITWLLLAMAEATYQVFTSKHIHA